jgi:hypothetical protein
LRLDGDGDGDGDSDGSNVREVSVWTKQIPNSWKEYLFKETEIYSGCSAILVRNTGNSSSGNEGTLVTNRMEWYPKAGDANPIVPAHLVAAASIGIDVSLFDDLEHGRKVTARDRECFYQLLSRADRIADISTGQQSIFSIADLLQKPRNESGAVYTLTGVARRAIRIPVNDPDIRQRFNIDHYFEVDVFVPLEPALTLVDEDTGAKNTYRDFPMTFCVRKLPTGFPEGPVITQPVRMTGMYFKLWAYRNELLNAESRNSATSSSLQQSPLFIGYSPNARILLKQSFAASGLILGLAFAAFVALIVGMLIRTSRRDRIQRQQAEATQPIIIEIPE